VSEKSTRKAPDYADESKATRNRSIFRPELQFCLAILLKSGIVCANQGRKRRFQIMTPLTYRAGTGDDIGPGYRQRSVSHSSDSGR
jgi:hypothetical protein